MKSGLTLLKTHAGCPVYSDHFDLLSVLRFARFSIRFFTNIFTFNANNNPL